VERKKTKWYQATERMLYTYKSMPIRIMSLRQHIELVRQHLEPTMISNYELQEGKSYSVSSPVEAAALNRIEGEAVQKLELKIKNLETLKKIVEVSIDTMLDAEQRKLVKMIYFQNMTWQQTCMELSVDKNTYYAKKNDIVKLMAWCFGYMPDDVAEEVWGLFADQALMQRHMVG